MPRRSGSAIPSAMHVVDAGHDVAVVDAPAVADHGLREGVAAADAAARVRAAARVAGRGEQHRVRLGVREVRAPAPGRSAVHADDRRQRPLGALRRHQHPFDLDAALPRPADRCARRGRPGPRRCASLNDDPARPGARRRDRTSPAPVRRRAPDASSRRRRRPSVITQAGVVIASPMNASPRHRSSRRPSSQMRPHALPVPSVRAYQSEPASAQDAAPTVSRSGQGSVAPPDARSIDPQAARQQAVVARVPLDDRDAVRSPARARGPPTATPARTGSPRSAPRDRGARPSPGTSPSPGDRSTRARRRCRRRPTRPPTRSGRADRPRSRHRRQVDQEQPPPRIAGPAHDRIGRRLRAGHGPRAPVESVRARVRGEDQQPPAVARPGDALGTTRRASRRAPARRRPRPSCTEADGPRAAGPTGTRVGSPSGDHAGVRSHDPPPVSATGTSLDPVPTT